MSVFFGLSS